MPTKRALSVCVSLLFSAACSDSSAPPVKVVATAHDAGDQGDDGGHSTIPASGEVCDGIDNDGNGLVDDADVDGDGVCDCLRIGSLGAGGISSSGEIVFSNWPNAHSQNPVVALGDTELSDDVLKNFDVLIVLYVAPEQVSGGDNRTLPAHHTFSDDEVAALQRWSQGGGGLMTTAGYSADEGKEVENVNRLLAPFGMAYSTTKLNLNGYIQNWVPHPITFGVHNIYTANGVEPDGPAGLTLAKDANDHVALQVTQGSDQRVLVWGDEWITYESQWQAVKDQQVERLWLNSLYWLSRPGSCELPIIPVDDRDE